MEFTRLSQVTGDLKYERLAMDLTKAIMAQPTKLPGLYPNTWTVDPFLPVESSKFKSKAFSHSLIFSSRNNRSYQYRWWW